MSFRRLVALGVTLPAIAVLAGCGAGGPAPEPPEQRARIKIVLQSDGGARLDLRAAGKLKSDAEVRTLARRVATRLFPAAGGVRVRTEDGRGMPFARAEIKSAYRTGRAPSLRIDTAGAVRSLGRLGFSDIALKLRLPSVPATVRADAKPSGHRTWRLRGDAPPPMLRVEMRPRPAHWLAVIVLPLLGAAGVGMAFFVRRRIFALPAAGLAVAAAIIALTASAGRRGDNLGVAGLLDGTALRVATAAPLAAVPLGLPAAMLLAVMLVRHLNRPAAHGYETRPKDTGAFW